MKRGGGEGFPRFYPILDSARLAAAELPLVDVVSAALRAGVSLLQVRHKGPHTRQFFAQLSQASGYCRDHTARLIVNDRADIAALVDAGCHVGQDDLPPGAVRRILGPKRLLGFSTHNEAQLREAATLPVDYLALGPIFATASKDKPDPTVGLAGLSRLRPLSPCPLVAIGGITRENALAVLHAGADSVAVIADLFPDPCDVASFEKRLGEWLNLLGK